MSGLLGNAFHRGALLAVGTLLWAAFSAGFGLSQTYAQVRGSASFVVIRMANWDTCALQGLLTQHKQQALQTRALVPCYALQSEMRVLANAWRF